MDVVFKDRVYLKGFTREFLHQAMQAATIKNKALMRPEFDKFDVTKSPGNDTRCFMEIHPDGSISLPRGFPLQDFKEATESPRIDDQRTSGAPLRSAFPKRLRELLEGQRDTVEKVVKAAKTDPFGTFMVVLPVSSGKTTIASIIAAELGLKTLILVDSTIIFEGWFRDLCQIFSITTDSIGAVRGPTKKIGSHFTVAMMQTVRNMEPSAMRKFLGEFGTIIMDEAHCSAAETYWPVLDASTAKYRIGITATRERKDGMHKLLHLMFNGEFLVKAPPEEDTKVSMLVDEVRLALTKLTYPYSVKDDYNAYIETVTTDADRNEEISRIVAREVALGHRVLVATCRRAHADDLRRLTASKISRFPTALVTFMGGSKRSEIQSLIRGFADGRHRALFTTTQFIVKGANIPQFDRLVICYTLGFYEQVIQLLGRVQRRHEGKRTVVVYDFLDHLVEHTAIKHRAHHLKAYRLTNVRRITSGGPETWVSGTSARH